MNADERLNHKLSFIANHPEIVDWYIRHKEETKEDANDALYERIGTFENVYNTINGRIKTELSRVGFDTIPVNTYEEVRQKAAYFKHVLEDNDVYQLLYCDGVANFDERTINLLFRPLWMNTESDVSYESNNGRGAADVKVSRGAHDKCIVEFKLASNTKLKQNLAHQTEIYKKAHDAEYTMSIVVFKDDGEYERVMKILKELNLINSPDVVLIDVSRKLSASKVK